MNAVFNKNIKVRVQLIPLYLNGHLCNLLMGYLEINIAKTSLFKPEKYKLLITTRILVRNVLVM